MFGTCSFPRQLSSILEPYPTDGHRTPAKCLEDSDWMVIHVCPPRKSRSGINRPTLDALYEGCVTEGLTSPRWGVPDAWGGCFFRVKRLLNQSIGFTGHIASK